MPKKEKDEVVEEVVEKVEKTDREKRWEVFCEAAREQARQNDKRPHEGVSYLTKIEDKLAKGMPETFR